MLIGPVFSRELVTAPRRVRFYVAPAVYVGGLVVLMSTAWLLLTGTQQVRGVGDLARFGATLFQFLAPLQLVLAMFFSAFAAASAVAQEKDRRTLVLLLLTNLSNAELVLGKLLASLLHVLVILAAAVPFFLLAALFGGISAMQIALVFVVTALAALAAGSVGSMIALWREKSFQTLAMTAMVLGALAAWEVVVASGQLAGLVADNTLVGRAIAISPWQALQAALRPSAATNSFAWFSGTVPMFCIACAAFIALVNGAAILLVRVWNPSREARPRTEEADEFRTADAAAGKPSVHAAKQKTRAVRGNPIYWRETATWAYGRKILIVRLAYWALFAGAALGIYNVVQSGTATREGLAMMLVPLFLLSLVLVNALAVTSITTERDLGALDLLLVTDITPKEFIFGKLGGAFFVAKEMVLLPLALCIYLHVAGKLSLENLCYLLGGLMLMNVFVATLGIHAGLAYANSRGAVAVSLGTVFFLFLGVATCMRIMVSFSGSFQLQLAPFLAFMIGGSAGLFVALGARNPSQAIALASLLLPALTFVGITSFLNGETLGVFMVTSFTYGLTTAAMLVPAVAEFDLATGRTTE